MIKALIPLAEGVEEMEAVIIIDVLRRAQWTVTTAAISPQPITASRGVQLLADSEWSAVKPESFDVLILPGGGGGTQALKASASVLNAVRDFHKRGKWVAAICAAPLVLQEAGILKGVKATCYPGVGKDLTATPRRDERVVVDGRIVTSQGPGTAFAFALTLVRLLESPALASALAQELVLASADAF